VYHEIVPKTTLFTFFALSSENNAAWAKLLRDLGYPQTRILNTHKGESRATPGQAVLGGRLASTVLHPMKRNGKMEAV